MLPLFESIRRGIDRIMDYSIPTIGDIKENYQKKHHPIQYATQHYVESLNLEDKESRINWDETSKNLAKLSIAEKNYTQNDPKPSYIRKAIGGLISLLTIFAVINKEKTDVIATKALPFVFKERDQD